MDASGWYVLTVGVGTIIAGVIGSSLSRPDRAAARFRWLEVFTGRSEAEILGRVGPPERVERASDGGRSLVWTRLGCGFTLTFDPEGICRGMELSPPVDERRPRAARP